ncbi:MAG: hypothetical protein SAJ37_05905 [Oscillatoria sp. PMC 1068.18]|nr:hypothetical protein [Oscillatoria sp. PMC 1076.18]MEC4988266.1 hypothetical protein [Oscillatoria sp. PMC 1068.18]
MRNTENHPNPDHRPTTRIGNDPNAHVEVNPHSTTDPEKAAAYESGYVQGQVTENNRERRNLTVRDNDNAARGLLIGIIATSLVALAVGLAFLFNDREPEIDSTPPAIVPSETEDLEPENQTNIIEEDQQPDTTIIQEDQQPDGQTTIIERNNTETIREQVPVPVEQDSSSEQQSPASNSTPQSTEPRVQENNTTIQVTPSERETPSNNTNSGSTGDTPAANFPSTRTTGNPTDASRGNSTTNAPTTDSESGVNSTTGNTNSTSGADQ